MTEYPVIDRRDGRLFFSLDVTDRVSIATSVERLIDLLDAYEGDCDLEQNGDEFDASYPEGGRRLAAAHLEDDEDGGDSEPWLGWPNAGQRPTEAMMDDDREEDNSDCEDNGDAEPLLGAPERHPLPSGFAYGDDPARHTQERWSQGYNDECEEENEHGGDVQDEPHDERDDDEPSLGWTSSLDQSSPARFGSTQADDIEENGDEEDCSHSEDELDPRFRLNLHWDGRGVADAEELLSRAKPRIKPYSRIVGERDHILRDGSVFTTFLPI